MDTTLLCIGLVNETINYLKDAGFNSALYTINDFNNERGYIEVEFNCDKSVDFIMKDIKKTIFKEILEIKKYKLENRTTAIFTFK